MRIARVVDLSVPLDADTQVFPGDPPVTTAVALHHDLDGVEVRALTLGSQSGTHVDAPRHVLPGAAAVDELPLSAYVRRAVVADLRGLPPRTRIDCAGLAPWLSRLGPDDALVLHTGWSHYYGTPAYWDHPVLDEAAALAVVQRGVRLVAVDAPSVDETRLQGAGLAAADLQVHRVLARVGAVVVENLTGLEGVDFPDPLLSVLPLRLTGADGAPCRAVALQLVAGPADAPAAGA